MPVGGSDGGMTGMVRRNQWVPVTRDKQNGLISAQPNRNASADSQLVMLGRQIAVARRTGSASGMTDFSSCSAVGRFIDMTQFDLTDLEKAS